MFFKNFASRVKILILIFAVYSCDLKKSVKSPNILFIMADDHTSQAWGIYGGVLKNYVKNNAIKYLANNGTTLNNMFCTNSICVPSRASILTGQYSHVNGVYTLSDFLSPDSLNVAKILQKNGYETALVGK
jgi:arylsulfatase A-like enzyme